MEAIICPDCGSDLLQVWKVKGTKCLCLECECGWTSGSVEYTDTL